jgi:hypothetical protein
MTNRHTVSRESPTRSQRVREILQTAAGSSTANYGGVGRFWNLWLKEFMIATVHGVRMSAPELPPCCAGEPGAETSAVPVPV